MHGQRSHRRFVGVPFLHQHDGLLFARHYRLGFHSCRYVPAKLWNPAISTGDASFGVQNNYFGFNITGTNNYTVVVELCTNMASPVWVPLATNTLVNGVFYFSEPFQANSSGRFYGLGLP